MTHLLDTSAILAYILDEPGAERVDALLGDPSVVVGISVLTLFEVATGILHQTGSKEAGIEAMQTVRQAVQEIVVVSEAIVTFAVDLRMSSTSRVALADCLIGATASTHGAVLVHRDPHFNGLPAGLPLQESLPQK